MIVNKIIEREFPMKKDNNQLPISKRDYGWYNKFTNTTPYKHK